MLPDGTHLRNAFTYSEIAAGGYYKDRWNREMKYKYYDFILDHRLNIDNLYRARQSSVYLMRRFRKPPYYRGDSVCLELTALSSLSRSRTICC